MVSVTLTSPSAGSLTLSCSTAAYPYVGREINREIIVHEYRDGGSATPDLAAGVDLEVRPFSVKREPLNLVVPFATETVNTFFLNVGASSSAELTMVDGYGTRVFLVSKVTSRPRTDFPGRFDCALELVRKS